MRTVWTIARAHRARLGAFAVACLSVLVPAFAQQQGPIQVNTQGVSISFQNSGGDATVSRGVSILFNNQGGNAASSNGTTISFQDAQDARSNSGVTIGFSNSCILSCTATAATTGAAGASISFGSTAGSTAPLTGCGGAVRYDWNFGDRTPHSTEPNPTHTYNSAGIYSWTLTTNVSGASACVRTGRITIGSPSQYCLTTSVSPPSAGTVTAGGCYNRGSSVSLQAIAAAGYRFGYWSGDVTGVSTAATQNVQMVRDKNLVANFVSVGTSLSGTIRIADGPNFWPLNGDGITCISVTAKPQGGSDRTATVDRSKATYEFTNLPVDIYDLNVVITYRDTISENTTGTPEGGCPNTVLYKTVLYQKTINTTNLSDLDINLPPPLVMVHGISNCYTKWYSPDSNNSDMACNDVNFTFGNKWDNYARQNGLITFTPNYYWKKDETHPWELLATQVRSQVETNLRSLSRQTNGGKYAPWIYIGHSQGGLVARVLTSGDSRGTSVVRSLQKIYLLGTPNSGAISTGVGLGHLIALIHTQTPYLTQSQMRKDFNFQYGSFGSKDSLVRVFAGTKQGIFITVSAEVSDKVVPVDSVHHIYQRSCSWGICNDFPYGFPPYGFINGYDLFYDHYELASLESLDILSSYIFPDIGSGPAKPTVRSKVTVSSSTTAGLRAIASQLRTVAANQMESFTFPVGMTDRFELNISLDVGAGAFSLINPAGQSIDFSSLPDYAGQHVSDESGEAFVLNNPAAGLWTLRTVTGGASVVYRLDIAENSPLGFAGFAETSPLAIGQTAHLFGQWSGDLTGVASPTTAAVITDEQGAVVGSVALFDDGAHGDGAAGDGVFGGDSPALTNMGRYAVAFSAQGTYNGQPFTRWAEASVDVISSLHHFTGDFADGAYDGAGDGSFDTLQETAVVNVPAAGSYLVSADLEDAHGYFISHAVGHLQALALGSYSVSMAFELSGVFCGQYAAPFSIKNLTLSDAVSLKTLDVWTGSVTTQSYDGSLFGCVNGTTSPTITGIQPGAMFPGDSKQVIINGKSFQNGAQVSFGAGVTVSSVTFGSSTTLLAQVGVAAGAAPGPRDVTITNPDGHASIAPALFNVALDQPPSVSINNVTDGQTVTGVVTVSASATDDIGIQKVEFYLDGALQTRDTTFPYQFVWNTFASSNAPHTLLAKAYDTANHTTTAQISVNVSCVAAYSPSSLFFPLNGGSGSVNVSSANACSWEVATSDAWISITSAGIGSGSDVVTFEIRENFTASARTGTLSIGGKTVTIVQDGGLGEDCQYSISPAFTSFSAGGGIGTIQVFAAERCAWQATTSDTFITITSGGIGIGNGTVTYTVGTNPGASGRKGTITIAGQTFAVKQKGN